MAATPKTFKKAEPIATLVVSMKYARVDNFKCHYFEIDEKTTLAIDEAAGGRFSWYHSFNDKHYLKSKHVSVVGQEVFCSYKITLYPWVMDGKTGVYAKVF